MKKREIPLWHNGNISDYNPWGCGFDPWPHSVGLRSSVAMSCCVCHRFGSCLKLFCLQHRPAAATLFQSLAWELPYVMGAALKKKKEWTEMVMNAYSTIPKDN